MALNDIYQLELWYNYRTLVDNASNVFFFLQTSSAGGAADLIQGFQDDWQTPILDTMGGGVKANRIVVKNLFDVGDFDSFVYASDAGFGTRAPAAADLMPSFCSITYRLVQTTRAIRSGYKRFGGIVDGTQVDNSIVDAGMLAAMELLRTTLVGFITGGTAGGTFDHVVVKRIPYVTPAGKNAYRLPITQAEADYSVPTQCLVNRFVTTQDSRKV